MFQTSKFKEELEHYRMKSDSAEQTLQNTKLELDQQLLTLDSLNRQIDALQRALGMICVPRARACPQCKRVLYIIAVYNAKISR